MEHRALALEAAQQSFVLLKNARRTLPLRPSTLRSISLIGPHANSSVALFGSPNYHGDNKLVFGRTPLLAARARLAADNITLHYARGCDVDSDDDTGIAEAIEAAATADAILFFLGLDSSVENEGLDRADLALPGLQLTLVQKVLAAAPTEVPVVVVLINGGAVAIRELSESPKVGAILEAFYPGQYGGIAITQMLFGDVSPSGLLPYTIYDKEFVFRRNITDMGLRELGGVTYRYFEGTPLWHFGFGLSYTEFAFQGASLVARVAVTEMERHVACFPVNVSNVGRSTSDVVVLGFISSNHTDAPRNPKLFDFAREASLYPGELRRVSLCAGEAVKLVDSSGVERVLPGTYQITVGVRGGVGGDGAGSVIGHLRIEAVSDQANVLHVRDPVLVI